MRVSIIWITPSIITWHPNNSATDSLLSNFSSYLEIISTFFLFIVISIITISNIIIEITITPPITSMLITILSPLI